MPLATLELTTQQLIDALGIDVTEVHEVNQDYSDFISGKVRLLVDAKWARHAHHGSTFPCYLLEDVPLRINPQVKE